MDRARDDLSFPVFSSREGREERLKVAVLELARKSPAWSPEQIAAELNRSERETLAPVTAEQVSAVLAAEE